MNRIVLGILMLIAAGAGGIWFWSTSSSNGETKRLILTGSSTVAPLASEIGKRFESLHPGVRVDVQTGGSSRGIADARRGTADIGMSSRALKASESAGIASHLLAHDGVAMLVHADNPLTDLSDEQIRAIYTGRVSRWSDLGGHEAPITVINRAEGRAELEVLCEHLGLQPTDLHADLVSGENQHGIKTVAGDRNAIVYMSVGASEFAAGQGEPVKLLRWNGVAPSSPTVASGTFPVSRPLILITPEDPTGLAKDFIDYCQSEQVHDLIKAQYFIPPAR